MAPICTQSRSNIFLSHGLGSEGIPPSFWIGFFLACTTVLHSSFISASSLSQIEVQIPWFFTLDMISVHSRQAVHGSSLGTDSNSNQEYTKEKTGSDGAEVDGADSASCSGSEELDYPDGGRGWLIVFGVSREILFDRKLKELTAAVFFTFYH